MSTNSAGAGPESSTGRWLGEPSGLLLVPAVLLHPLRVAQDAGVVHGQSELLGEPTERRLVRELEPQPLAVRGHQDDRPPAIQRGRLQVGLHPHPGLEELLHGPAVLPRQLAAPGLLAPAPARPGFPGELVVRSHPALIPDRSCAASTTSRPER